MAQTEEFMFQNVAYRPTVYRTGMATNLKKSSELLHVDVNTETKLTSMAINLLC